jgi:hypothetical protein
MQRDGLSMYVEGTMKKDDVTKALKLGFTTDPLDKDCAGELNGAFIRGLVVPPDGLDQADVTMSAVGLFADDLVASSAVSRGEAIAAADANADGVITVAELQQVTLDAAKGSGGSYGVGDQADVADLGAFMQALSRKTVTSFRSKGACVALAQDTKQ